jgi:hypothetical protein
LAWIDALLNAATLLGGMGPVGDLQSWSAAGKNFASFHALYSGIIFLIAAGLLFAPVFHNQVRAMSPIRSIDGKDETL